MLTDALNRLVALARESSDPRRIAIDDPYRHYVIAAGELREFKVPPRPRDHAVETIEDLIAIANRFAATEPVTVWFNSERVVVQLDDPGHRLSRVTLGLVTSKIWKTLLRFEDDLSWHPHADFVRLLRFELRAALPPVALLEVVRKLKFETGAVTTSVAERHRESLGRDITQAVTADSAKIPEYVTLQVPVYTTPGLRDTCALECSVDVDAGRGTLRLRPMPDELDRVLTLVLEGLQQRLTDEITSAVGIYRGCP